jgi:signal transduction histidine kinase
MELVLEALEIRDVVKDVRAATSSLFAEKPVEMIIDLEDEVPGLAGPAKLYADKLRLNQILLNLVSNAAKFTHEGSVTIKSRILETQPDMMLISVTDTGIGISTDKMETIFDRFRQADSSTARRYGGTGLGLAICKQLVQMHGGEIGVKTVPDVGSEFYFTIPLVEPRKG